LFTVSGCPTDALVSDYNSKNRRSIGQETRWLVPADERPARRIFAPSLTQSRENSEHVPALLREQANTSICLPEIGFGHWNYSGFVEPLWAAIEYGACLIDTAGERIGTDLIDLYQLHWPNLAIPIEEPMRGMEKLADEGKVRFTGSLESAAFQSAT
jgi:hypothetical protein